MDDIQDHFRAVQRGDLSAFEALFRLFYQDLYAQAFRIVGTKVVAEELVQDLFIHLWENRRKVAIPASPKAYLFTAIRNRSLYYSETEPGIYLTDSLQGVPGRTYTLTIQWQGTTYTATDSMGAVPEAFEPISFTSELGIRQFEYRRHQFGFAHPNQWQLIVHRADTSTAPPVEEPYYGQQVGQVILPPGDTRFTFFTHTNIEVSGLMNFEDAHFYGFRPGRWVTQKRFSLSAAYYDYLRGVFLETEWRESLFAGTPANPRGNVSQGALGFFSASAVRTERFRLE